MGKIAAPTSAPAPVNTPPAGTPPADQASTPPAGTPPADQADTPPATTEVRVLIDCQHGKVDTVAALGEAELAEALASGTVDPHPDAVAYAKQLAAAAAQA